MNNTIQPKERLLYFDTIRVLCTFSVIFCHWSNVFESGWFDVTKSETILQKIWIGSPLNIVNNGNFGVCFFFVLSGWLITYKVYEKEKDISISNMVIHNFIKIARLVVPAILFSWLLMKFGLMYHLEACKLDSRLSFILDYNDFSPSTTSMIKDIIRVFYTNSSDYNSPLWTMCWELLGSVVITISVLVVKELRGGRERKE